MRARIDVVRRTCPGLVRAAFALAVLAPPGAAVAAPDDEEEEDPDFPTKRSAEKDEESDDELDARIEADAEDKEEAESRLSGKAAKAAEKKKKWIKRWAPQRDMLDIGMSIGALFNPSNHGMFDAGEGPRPPLDRAAFDFDFRISYMPLSFLGFGIETGVMPTLGDDPEVRADQFTFRALALAQIPYRITPTFAIGGGMLGIRSPNTAILNEIDGAFVWGLGLKMYVNQWIAVRIDGRHIVTGKDGSDSRPNYGELLFGVDVTLRMRRLIKSRKRDSDGDGVDDKYDTCPKESGDGDDGCPTKKDSDNDGWIDKEDKCPKEYGDGARGCPVPDQDSDGIYDNKDECETEPEVRNGFKDTDGCPDEAPAEVKRLTGVIGGITFDTGQATIRKSSRGALLSVVATLKEYPDIRLEIVGHTDDEGNHDFNVQLSKDRAEAVRGYLVSQGVAAERVSARGVGPDEPIADNKTKAGRAKNRRIEFKVLP